MVGCSAVNCSNSSTKKFRLFRFPTDEERRKKWIINCRRDIWKPGVGARICEINMDSFLICSVLLFFMFTGGQSASFSQSCSFVNGVRQCTSDQSNGNVAMSSSQAGYGGPNGAYQSNQASTGNTGTGTFNTVGMQSGNVPPGGMFMPMPMPGFGPGFGPGGAQAGAFVGNMAPGGFNPFGFVQGFMMGRR